MARDQGPCAEVSWTLASAAASLPRESIRQARLWPRFRGFGGPHWRCRPRSCPGRCCPPDQDGAYSTKLGQSLFFGRIRGESPGTALRAEAPPEVPRLKGCDGWLYSSGGVLRRAS